MKSTVVSFVIKVLIPVFAIFSVYTFFRGHDKPGGGFIAALIIAIVFVFNVMVNGENHTKQTFYLRPTLLISVGLSLAIFSALLPMAFGHPFMKAMWVEHVPILHIVGTPTLFDLGIYVVVLGVVMKITYLFYDEEDMKKEN